MSLNSIFNSKIYVVSLCCILLNSNLYSQKAKWKVNPYANGITSINEGFLEFGPEIKTGKLILRPLIRLPLTDKKQSLAQIDRQTTTWKSATTIELQIDKTKESGKIEHVDLAAQFELGYNNFTYFPSGNQANKQKESHTSYSIEVKALYYLTKGGSGAKQWAPQIRVRYSRDWEEAKETGVVVPPDSSGISTVINLRITPPSTSPTFSPAFSLPFYPGSKDFSFAPTFYYDLKGKKGSHISFGELGRLRIEGWFFYYPSIKNAPNVRIGLAPFWSRRTHGKDNLEKVIIGGILQLKIGANLLTFF